MDSEEDMQLEQIKLHFKTKSKNKETMLSEKNPKDQKCYKLNLKEIPFCAGKSTTPSHNVGLNIQGIYYTPYYTSFNKCVTKLFLN